MTKKNKFGLSRTIEADIKREIRQNSKFGCVVCRCAIYEYEHIIPEFKEATSHDPDHMCLLCGQCHNKVTKGLLSKETIQQEYGAVRSSSVIPRPFEKIDLRTVYPTIVVGNCKFVNPKSVIEINGDTILALNTTQDNNGLPSLTGVFTDDKGRELIRIVNNEWQGSIEHWDLTTIGNEIVVRYKKGHVALKIKLEPPSTFIIQTLDIQINSCHLYCKNGEFKIGRRTKYEEVYLEVGSLIAQHPTVGISVKNDFDILKLSGFRVTGGEGIFLEGTGISLAENSMRMHLRNFVIEHATRQWTLRRTMFERNDFQGTTNILAPRIK